MGLKLNNETKSEILELLERRAAAKLKAARESYRSALELSRSEEMKPEGKYDTRAIEAGYLTDAKKRRVAALEAEHQRIKTMRPESSGGKAATGSLVQASGNGEEVYIFISPAACEPLSVNGRGVKIVSAASPLGAELLGLEAGDLLELETPAGDLEFEILQVF